MAKEHNNIPPGNRPGGKKPLRISESTVTVSIVVNDDGSQEIDVRGPENKLAVLHILLTAQSITLAEYNKEVQVEKEAARIIHPTGMDILSIGN